MEKEINFTQKKNQKTEKEIRVALAISGHFPTHEELLWLFLVTFLLTRRQNVRTRVYFFFFF